MQIQIEIIDKSEINDRSVFEDAYYALAAIITEILCSHDVSPRDVATPSPVASVFNTSEFRTNIRLPKLDLPKFSGQYDE